MLVSWWCCLVEKMLKPVQVRMVCGKPSRRRRNPKAVVWIRREHRLWKGMQVKFHLVAALTVFQTRIILA